MKPFHINHIVTLLLAIAIGSASYAQQTTEQIEFGKLNITELNNGYISINLKGCNAWTQSIGNPKLPTLQWLINSNENTTIEILSVDSIWISLDSNTTIEPTQPSHLKSEQNNDWYINYDLYAKDTLYGAPLINIESLGFMGQNQLARITIAPIKYNPQRNQLLIYNHINYRIIGNSPRKVANREPKYIAVIPWKYAKIAQPLMQWRKQLGWNVEEMYVSNGDKDSIRNALKEKYQNNNAPTYILLVGGTNDIKSFSGKHAVESLSNRLTDLYYGEYTKDWYPEAIVGRLSVNDTTELKQVINKILQYEQNPDTNALKKSLIVAGEEDRTPAPITTNGQVNYVSKQLSNKVDTFCFRNPESNTMKDSIVSTLRKGIGFINYTSHCLFDQWRRPTIDGDEMDSIAQTTGIWINNCCSSNRFGHNCLGEHLLRQPHGGGIGIIGSSNETFWEEDYYWSIGAKRPININPTYDSLHLGAIDHLLNKETLGEILLAGNLAITAAGSPYEAYYWEIYCLLGDPATRPYIGTTPKVNATHIESLQIGLNNLSLNGEPNACVTILQNNEIIGKCKLDNDGNGTMQLKTPLNENNIIITSSKAWYRPQIDTLAPQHPNGEYLMLNLSAETDSIAMGENIPVKIICKNVGLDTAKNHQIELIQTAEDSTGAWLTQPWSKTITSLAPNAADTTEINLSLAQLNNLSLLKFHLNANKNQTIYNSHEINWIVKRSKLETTITITDGENIIQKLMPHQQYTIDLNLKNTTSYPIENTTINLTIENYPNKIAITNNWTIEMNGNEEQSLTFDFNTDDTLQGIWITTQIKYDGITEQIKKWWIVGNAHENFENGNLKNYTWINNSLNPWEIDSITTHNGKYSLKSGKINHHERCDISLWINVPTNDTIGFWYKTSSESDHDKLYFYIDTRECFFASSIQDWSYWEMPIIKGPHKLIWRYQKNNSESLNEDAVWIDDIRLPFTQWDTICGPMDSICYNNTNNIKPIIQNNSWRVWPNPAKNIVNIQCNEKGKIEIWDYMGRKIDSFKIENSTTTQYSIANLRFKFYLLVYINDKGANTQKLIITP